MPTDCFWEILREQSKNAHKERVSKTPERIAFAEKMLDQHGEVKSNEVMKYEAGSDRMHNYEDYKKWEAQ